jgi:hypothetical protein
MRRTLLACALVSQLCCGTAAAVPGAGEPSTIHVNATRNPEIHKYKAILAGRNKALETVGQAFRLGPGNADRGDDALVELRFEAPAAITGTAAGTPRTAP